MTLEQVVGLAPVVSELVIEDVRHAAPLGRALAAGGLKALEVTYARPRRWIASRR